MVMLCLLAEKILLPCSIHYYYAIPIHVCTLGISINSHKNLWFIFHFLVVVVAFGCSSWLLILSCFTDSLSLSHSPLYLLHPFFYSPFYYTVLFFLFFNISTFHLDLIHYISNAVLPHNSTTLALSLFLYNFLPSALCLFCGAY